ncbi:hypothetical protein PMAYCL1PPCAC_13079, partial [Pristionchus mayeri]
MQFYKWANLDKASDEAIQILLSMSIDGGNDEVKDILFMLVSYIRSQRKKEKEYKDKMKRKAEDEEPMASSTSREDKDSRKTCNGKQVTVEVESTPSKRARTESSEVDQSKV